MQRDDDLFAPGLEKSKIGPALGIVPVVGVAIFQIQLFTRSVLGLDNSTGRSIHENSVGGNRKEFLNSSRHTFIRVGK